MKSRLLERGKTGDGVCAAFFLSHMDRECVRVATSAGRGGGREVAVSECA